jgi:hypothetical protein
MCARLYSGLAVVATLLAAFVLGEGESMYGAGGLQSVIKKLRDADNSYTHIG